MEQLSQLERQILNRAMQHMMEAYNNDYASVIEALEKVTPIISRSALEASKAEIELVIRALFNTTEIKYWHIRKFTKILFGVDSPELVLKVMTVIMSMDNSPVHEDNPFSQLTEIDVD